MEQHIVEHLKKVTLKEVTGIDTKYIDNGTELFYIHELNKYLEQHGLTLNLEELVINEQIHMSNYYSFFVKRYPHMRAEGLKLTDFKFQLIFPPSDTTLGVNLKDITTEGETVRTLEYDYYFDYEANGVLHRNNSSTGYVSLFADKVVEAYITNTSVPNIHFKIVDKNTDSVLNDILILKYYGNKFAEDKIEICTKFKVYTKTDLKEEIWSAYHLSWNQKGFMPTFQQSSEAIEDDSSVALVGYSIKDKYKFLKTKYTAGDVVFLYERTKTSASNKKASIDRCFFAVIKSFDENNIVIEKLVTGTTWYSQYANCDRLKERDDLEGTVTLKQEDYVKNVKYTTTYNLTEIGIDQYLRYETVFILEINDFDEAEMLLYELDENGNRRGKRLMVDSLEYTYAIMEERGIDYNKQRFLSKYFKGKTPVYEQYRDFQIKP